MLIYMYIYIYICVCRYIDEVFNVNAQSLSPNCTRHRLPPSLEIIALARN